MPNRFRYAIDHDDSLEIIGQKKTAIYFFRLLVAPKKNTEKAEERQELSKEELFGHGRGRRSISAGAALLRYFSQNIHWEVQSESLINSGLLPGQGKVLFYIKQVIFKICARTHLDFNNRSGRTDGSSPFYLPLFKDQPSEKFGLMEIGTICSHRAPA